MADLTTPETGIIALVAGSIGAAIKWIFSRRDGHVTKLEKRIEALESANTKLNDELRELWTAFSMVAAALHVADSDNAALKVFLGELGLAK